MAETRQQMLDRLLGRSSSVDSQLGLSSPTRVDVKGNDISQNGLSVAEGGQPSWQWEDYAGSGTQGGVKIPGYTDLGPLPDPYHDGGGVGGRGPGAVPNMGQGSVGTGSGNYEADFMRIYGGLDPSGKTLEQYWPQFQAMYPGAQLKRNASGYADAIILPNGQIIDTQLNSGYEKSDKWQWNPVGSSNFTDPTAQMLEDAVNGRLSSLMEPINRALQQQYERELQEQAANNTAIDEYVNQLTGRTEQLRAPVYSQGEEQILRSKATDPLYARRDATLKNQRENYLARTGFDPSSGTVTDLENTINRAFEQDATTIDSDITQNAIAERQNRDNMITQIQGMIANARGTKSADRLNALAQLSGLEASNFQQQEGRERERISTAAIMPELTSQRLSQAMQALGAGSQGSSVDSLLSTLLSNGNLNQNANAQASSQRSGTYSNIGSLIQLLFQNL